MGVPHGWVDGSTNSAAPHHLSIRCLYNGKLFMSSTTSDEEADNLWKKTLERFPLTKTSPKIKVVLHKPVYEDQ